MVRRREFSVFNLSFLDVIACGFGAVILFFIIINSEVKTRSTNVNKDMLNETEFLEERVIDGKDRLAEIKNNIEKTESEKQIVEGSIQELIQRIKELELELSILEEKSPSLVTAIEQLQTDIKNAIELKNRLQSQADSKEKIPGESLISFPSGTSNKQYLSGFKVEGNHVLLLVDASASMLGRTVGDVLRFTKLPDNRKRNTPKWRQVVNSVNWMSSKLDVGQNFQIYTFNTESGSVIDEMNEQWIEVKDGSEIENSITALREVVPEDGTNLYAAFAAASKLEPPPDNIYLLTDGLPTQSPDYLVKDYVTYEDRIKHFVRGTNQRPKSSVLHVLFYTMEGDPGAPKFYFDLAQTTEGSFTVVSRDWPL